MSLLSTKSLRVNVYDHKGNRALDHEGVKNVERSPGVAEVFIDQAESDGYDNEVETKILYLKFAGPTISLSDLTHPEGIINILGTTEVELQDDNIIRVAF